MEGRRAPRRSRTRPDSIQGAWLGEITALSSSTAPHDSAADTSSPACRRLCQATQPDAQEIGIVNSRADDMDSIPNNISSSFLAKASDQPGLNGARNSIRRGALIPLNAEPTAPQRQASRSGSTLSPTPKSRFSDSDNDRRLSAQTLHELFWVVMPAHGMVIYIAFAIPAGGPCLRSN